MVACACPVPPGLLVMVYSIMCLVNSQQFLVELILDGFGGFVFFLFLVVLPW
jgi:hypothetical protein